MTRNNCNIHLRHSKKLRIKVAYTPGSSNVKIETDKWFRFVINQRIMVVFDGLAKQLKVIIETHMHMRSSNN